MGKPAQKKEILKEVLFFLIKFNLILIPFYLIIYFDVDFYPIQEIFASIVGSILNFIGFEVLVTGFFIYVGDLVIDISRDCIGWKSAYSLFALVMASPGKFKDKMRFLFLWIPMVLLINLFRVLITIIVGLKFGPKYLEVFHEIFWQGIMILVIIGFWYLWFSKANKLNKRRQ
ncbi:MAG: archaeosortase/exosortase family protein [Candidatus Aenigmatarchaeota archaeon]